MPVKDSFLLQDEIGRAQRLLVLSSFVYTFADIRNACTLGYSKLNFDLLALEDDMMTTSQILNGAPHVRNPFATGSTLGFSVEDLVFCMFRIVSKFGLGDGERYLLGEVAPDAAGAQEGEKKSSDFIVAEETTLKSMDQYMKTLLGGEVRAGGGSRGILGTDFNFPYIQCFFDTVYQRANEGDKDFKCVLDMLQGNGSYQKVARTRIGRARARLRYARNFLTGKSIATDDSGYRSWQKALKSLKEVNPRIQNSDPTGLFDDVKIVWTNDRKNTAELVYTIVANKTRKTIVVIFRGSVTTKDWKENLDISTTLQPNPIQEDYDEKTETVQLRKGFWRFLLTARADNGRSKYDEIADKVDEYGKELGEDFDLRITGHSLGGALASLFAFYASTDPRFNQRGPVRACTFASPIVGKVSFAKAFKHQEDAGKLEYTRFVMAKDQIPNMRFFDKEYAHTGHRVELSADAAIAPAVSYMDDLSKLGTMSQYRKTNSVTALFKNSELWSVSGIAKYHAVTTYYDALESLS